METWMFYSFKGGSGRTVASANIAGALAKLNKRVLIIDMDIEAPGLHSVFQVEETSKFKAKRGIQDYLRGKMTLEQVVKDAIIDLSSSKDIPNPFSIPKQARFLYLMASSRSSVVFTGESDLHLKMQDLLDHLGKKEKLDYIILDAASGIREAYTLSVGVCDNIMIFFKWSRQHLEGTIKMVRLMEMMKKMDQGIWRPYKLIASAAPSEDDFGRINDKVLPKALRAAKKSYLKSLKGNLGEDFELFYEIPEIIELKWYESVMVFGRDDTHYDRIASMVVDITEKKGGK